MRHLLDLQPTILHFSGHGDSQGILLLGDDGQAQPVSADALSKVVRTTASATRLVVLNACYSNGQAEALRDVVGCAIGMQGTIADAAARSFAVGVQAEATLAAKRLDPVAHPRCLVRAGVDVDALVLGGPAAPPRRPPAAIPAPRSTAPETAKDPQPTEPSRC